MSFEAALRLTEILLGFALAQNALEHLASRLRGERLLFLPRLGLSLALMASVWPGLVGLALLGHSLVVLSRYDGPYNGGNDRMTLLCLSCLCAAHLLPERHWQELAFGYLALQLVLSYVMSGWVKIRNPDWRTGRALRDVFQFSAYPVSEHLRELARYPRLLAIMAWSVMLFEVFFAFSMIHATALMACLAVAALFHLANACLFGLNRFFWAWLAAYPSILWLQMRLMA